MFLRDEHVRNKLLLSRLKRQFGQHLASVEHDPTPVPDVPMSDSTTQGSAASTEAPVATNQGSGAWQSIADTLAGAADLDDIVADANGNSQPEELRPTSSLSIPLETLFNFEFTFWTESNQIVSARGLQEELELYQLLDLDADGEIDEEDIDALLND